MSTIGHNNGPPMGDVTDIGGRARLYYWRKAHKAAWRTPPIEIVRLRANAAEKLGLSYKDYTSILLDRGRRPSAVLFDLGGTLVRMRNGRIDEYGGGVTLMPGVKKRLQQLRDCAIFAVTDQAAVASETNADEKVERYIADINRLCAVDLAGYAIRTAPKSTAITDLLIKHHIPPPQAILVGDTAEDEHAATQAKLARFFWAWHYFAEGGLASA